MSLILINGVIQLVGVTSIFPFFSLAADPNRIRNSKTGSKLVSLLPPMESSNLLVIAGIFCISMLLLASLSSLLSEYVRVRYAYGFSHWLRDRLLSTYAKESYAYFLERNSAVLMQKIQDIQIFSQNVLLPVGEILTKIIIIALLSMAIFLVQPYLGIGSLMVFTIFYLIAFIVIKPKTKKIGNKVKHHSIEFWKNTNQFLHGIKAVIIHGKGDFFVRKASAHSEKLGKYQAKVPIYSNSPRYIIEPVALGGLVAVVVIMAYRGKPFTDILPNLSVMAFAGYKLLPALQIIYGQLVTASSSQYTLIQLEEEIGKININPESDSNRSGCDYLEFNRTISFKDISFSYPESDSPVISDFNLVIKKNESIGITGESGSGKSTLIDLLLGLHAQNTGQILIDNVPLKNTNIQTWRSMIGYVPQEIYLVDDTIEANIAFGVEPSEVDYNTLYESAEGAQILNFIMSELPDGFKTIVGERGVRLSGGQRQRIGIARALYNKIQVLILDEATSALDNETEKSVMDTVISLHGKMTIIAIAHRLSTIEKFDRIVKISKEY